ncbi:MAG: hypothetical protein ACREKQ_12890, partial [Candidatus Rokuibacteriota bacterium]
MIDQRVTRVLLLTALAWGGILPAAAHAATGETALAEWVGRLGEGLGPMIGAWINDEALLGVRWITVCLSGVVLILVGVADAILRWLVRRKVRRDEAQRQDAPRREALY